MSWPKDAELNERCDVQRSEAWEVIDADPEPFPCFGCEDGCTWCDRRPRIGKWASGSMPAVKR